MVNSTSDNDDLTPMQEYVIAGGVILLFGLLYWYLNPGWNGGTAVDMTAQTPAHQAVMLDQGKFAAAAKLLNAEIAEPNEADKKMGETVAVTTASSTTAAPVTALSTTAAATLATPTQVVPATQLEATDAPAIQNTAQLESGPVGQPSPAVTAPAAAPATPPTAYTLPDGTPIDISNSDFGLAFQEAIAKHQTDKAIVFKSIQFDSGSSKPNVQSGQPIKVLVALLHANPDVKLLIRGHTDEVGTAKDNTELSLVRANEVGVALVQAGIDRKRLRIMGMGSSEPISIDNTESARERNRRIDALILK